MIASSESPSLRPWLKATDPRVPMIATRAAVELDAKRRGVLSNMHAVRELSDLLKNSLTQALETVGTRRTSALLDPITTVVVGRALSSIPDRQTAKVADIEALLSEVADWLTRAASQSEPSHTDVLRDFCLALARGTSSHLRNFQDERPTHPNRR